MKANEEQRLIEITSYERNLWESGYSYVGGMDEVGRGPLAGPVVTCCLILPKQSMIEGVNDSKKCTPKKRDRLFTIIKEKAVSIGIGYVYPNEIDSINILNATKVAMVMAVESMRIKPEHLLIDAISGLPLDIQQTGIIKGDQKSESIAAASIIAKVTRDRLMIEYDSKYPQYGFVRNKGYGTKEHINALKEYGPCPIHRKTFIKHFISDDAV